MRRAILAAAASLLAAVWSAGPAAADYQSTTETVWQAPGPGPCLRTRAESSASDVQGPAWSFASTAEYGSTAGGTGCDTGPANVEPAGWLAARADLYRWDGSTWGLCAQWGWSYSDRSAEQFQQTWGGGYGPCGGGWYVALAFGAAYDGAAWQGDGVGVWSGEEWLEAPPGWTATPLRS